MVKLATIFIYLRPPFGYRWMEIAVMSYRAWVTDVERWNNQRLKGPRARMSTMIGTKA